MRCTAPILLLAAGLTASGLAATGDTVGLRLATFNVAMGMDAAGELGTALAAGNHARLRQVAEILQRVRPDILLLNEFDYDPTVEAAALFQENYLGVSQNGQAPLHLPHHFSAAVNTGLDSGLDLDRDGFLGGPADAWGFGHFPGQFGMLVLSHYPLNPGQTRTFRNYRWRKFPDARRPADAEGNSFYPEAVWGELRLSSKSHWDLVFDVGGNPLHLLAHHPTPPVFDGPENRNGLRNFDEIRFWLEYTRPGGADFIVDDQGSSAPLDAGARFVIAGDLNADPFDGDAVANAIGQLLDAPWIDSDCTPQSEGGKRASAVQGGVNRVHRGDPAADTADFNDRHAGNLRLDYLLPSGTLTVRGCGVFWPGPGEDGHGLVGVSDHRLVWLDVEL